MHKFRWLLVPLALAAALSLPAYAERFGGTPTSDSEIESDIRSAFDGHARLAELDIDVDVHGGRVMLSGDVPERTDIELARSVAGAVAGVTGINSSTLVAVGSRSAAPQSEPRKMDFAQRVQDMTLQADVRTKLLASNEINGVGIRVSVNNGVAVLEGRVADENTRQSAERIAREVRGIEQVDNLLVVGR